MGLGARFPTVLAAAQTGADWAVTLLYRELHPSLLAYLGNRQPAEAEDLASEVWVAVASGLGRFEGGEDAFRGWVFTIAARRLADFRRKGVRRRTEPVDPDDLSVHRADDDAEGEAVGAASAGEILERVRRILPDDQAEVIALRVVAGLSVEQAANVMGRRPGTIRVLQHRALRRLAESFSAERVTR